MYYILYVAIFLCYVLWSIYIKRRSTDPPDICGKLPLIGHTHHLIGNNEKIFHTIKCLTEDCMKKGGIAKLTIGFRTYYILTDPETCVTVSNACINKEEMVYGVAKPFLGESLVTANGATWKRHKKLLNPVFGQSVLNNFIKVFNNQSRRLNDIFSEKEGKYFNHEHILKINNLETICITTSGLNCDEYKESQQQYLKCLTDFFNISTLRFKRIWLQNDFIYRFSDLKRRQDKVVEDFLKLSNSIIQKKRNEIKNDVQIKTDKVKSFLDFILELSDRTGCFTDDEIRDETDTILAAGHDGLAKVLTCVFILLGSHHDIQEKVYLEIRKVLGDTDEDVSKENLSELVYTEAVLKETMRLYPITPVIARRIDREVKLKTYNLQPNTGVIFAIWGLHRNSIWGPDANEFKPERWLNIDTLPDINYFGGFGVGRRACIGKVYAMMSMKIIVVHVIRKYKLSSDINKIVWKFDVMTKVNNGDHLMITPRTII